jgi:hypothetical protein
MAQSTCEFCGETIKARGKGIGPALRDKERQHREDTHSAEMVPMMKFEAFAEQREMLTMMTGWLTEHDELNAFLAERTAQVHPVVRKLVEQRLRETRWTRDKMVKFVTDAAEASDRLELAWLRWVRDENTFGPDELLRLVKLRGQVMTFEDEKNATKAERFSQRHERLAETL